MTIPAQVHFCWIGPTLPWAYAFAVLSAAERGGLDGVVLHHTDPFANDPAVLALRDAPGVHLSRIDPSPLLEGTGRRIGVGDRLRARYEALDRPVMRADMLRAALLHAEGGIYLDLDTVTVASLRPLLDSAHLVATEYVVWPASVRQSRSIAVLGRHVLLDLARKACRTLPFGWALFRRIETLCVRQVNNAVLGAEAGSALLADYLRAMAALPAEALARRPTALGPDLLAAVLAERRRADIAFHAPATFSPLPPEISEHWFRPTRRPRLGAVLPAATRVVHWYASVRTGARVLDITPDYVRAHRHHQLYSMLVAACVPSLFRQA